MNPASAVLRGIAGYIAKKKCTVLRTRKKKLAPKTVEHINAVIQEQPNDLRHQYE